MWNRNSKLRGPPKRWLLKFRFGQVRYLRSYYEIRPCGMAFPNHPIKGSFSVSFLKLSWNFIASFFSGWCLHKTHRFIMILFDFVCGVFVVLDIRPLFTFLIPKYTTIKVLRTSDADNKVLVVNTRHQYNLWLRFIVVAKKRPGRPIHHNSWNCSVCGLCRRGLCVTRPGIQPQ